MVHLCLIRMWFRNEAHIDICPHALRQIWGSVNLSKKLLHLKMFDFITRPKKKPPTTSESTEKRWKESVWQSSSAILHSLQKVGPWPLPSSFDPFPFFCLLTIIAFTAHLQGHWLHLPSDRKTCWISACRAALLTLARRRQAQASALSLQ